MKKFLLMAACMVLRVTMAWSQQNFFNVPSSDITEKGRLFFQQQVNLLRDGIQSNTTLNKGLGGGFEAGINLLGLSAAYHGPLSFNRNEMPYGPFITANFQKGFTLGNAMAVSIGTQMGVAPGKTFHPGGYAYSNLVYHNGKKGVKLVAGPYAASHSFFGNGGRLGRGSDIGVQAGFEKVLSKDKWLLQSDFISGKHDLGEVVVGMACYLNRNWILSMGCQIPTFHSTSQTGAVLELTYNPHAE